MDKIFLILVFLVGALWEADAMSVTGELNGKIKITCSHVNAFNNVKYFCKGACKNKDVLIRSTAENKCPDQKYCIEDKGDTFFVTISRLTEDDSGTYWCGIDRIGLDTYNKVVLTVKKGDNTGPENGVPPTESGEATDTVASPSNMLVYIGAGLGVVVVALGIVLLMFFRYRKKEAFSGKDLNTVYAAPSTLKPDAHQNTTSSSTANGDEDRDHADNVYSNVTISSEALNQPDALFYSTVSFSKRMHRSTVSPAEVTYSTLAHVSSD